MQDIGEHFKGVTQYFGLANSFFKEAQSYLGEVQGWAAQIGTKLAECGIRLQTAQSYDQKSGMAQKEAALLEQKFDKKLNEFKAQFVKDPTDRRRR